MAANVHTLAAERNELVIAVGYSFPFHTFSVSVEAFDYYTSFCIPTSKERICIF